ncbi:hypothetical protein T439DRAFT_128091 [Meredithblackwellia eburnea MCA 4105]
MLLDDETHVLRRTTSQGSTTSLTVTTPTPIIYEDKFVTLTSGPFATLTIKRMWGLVVGDCHIPLKDINLLYLFNGGIGFPHGQQKTAVFVPFARPWGIGPSGIMWAPSFRAPTRSGMRRSYIVHVKGRMLGRLGFDVVDTTKFWRALRQAGKSAGVVTRLGEEEEDENGYQSQTAEDEIGDGESSKYAFESSGEEDAEDLAPALEGNQGSSATQERIKLRKRFTLKKQKACAAD